MKIEGKTVLITGATGFLGCRLAERLFLSNKQIKVLGLVHNPYNASRLARLPITLLSGDITSDEDMAKVTSGCDVVVHCAYGNRYETVKGTKTVIKASLKNHVQKFIHISSVAVYGYSPSENKIKNETCDYHQTDDEYCDSKIESEKIVLRFYKSMNLPTVILRPSNIFGPFSKPWTLGPVRMLKNRSYVLINGGCSPSNVVYVDNVVDAIELAVENEKAIGQAFNISDNEIVTWKTFYSRYSQMFCHHTPVFSLDLGEIKKERHADYAAVLKKFVFKPQQIPALLPLISEENKVANSIVTLVAKPAYKSKIIGLNALLPGKAKIKYTLASNEKNPPRMDRCPNKSLAQIWTLPYQFPIAKAKAILGYKPTISFATGMEITEKWLKYYRLLD
jgi:nucleoside-diphosphate-sugar epimerase